jgi:hypothetical protein
MPTKQSNTQTQSVKVVVNNKIACCDDKKKKRTKPKRKQQQEAPQEANEFPVLNTPVNSRYSQGGIAPMAVRNTVYIPNSAQITPEGMQYPIPSYFDRQYTNLTRTMEDFRDSMMKEIDDVRQTMVVRPQTPMVQEREDMQPSTSSPVRQIINKFESLGYDDDDEMYNTQDEEPLIPSSPEQSNIIDEFNKLFLAWEKTETYSNERKLALDDIRTFAQELGVNLINNTTNKAKSAQQLRADIRKKLKNMA